jgi:AAA15 family ATPase/GTPase
MLIRFTVENYLSFNELIDFNMIASAEERHNHHILQGQAAEDIDLLKTSIIYGANASGKSNLIKAMSFAQNFIVNGLAKNQTIDAKPFKLDSSCYKKPSRFEFEFSYQEKQYAYGFAVDKNQVHEEWLFEMGHEIEKPIFERVKNSISFHFEHELFVNLAEEEKQRISYEAKSTRTNLLFLTNCQERNIQSLESIYQWFAEILIIVFTNSKHQALTSLAKFNIDFFNKVIKLFNFGIDKIQIEEFKDKKSGNLVSKLITVRKNKTGNDVRFEISEESEGTQRFMDFIPMIIGLSKDKVFVIDEIERSLHTLLIRKLFELLLQHELFDSAQSQLIASTHEVNLLDIKNLFRKDEIWFMEKNQNGESVLYSLANADVDHLNITKGYLNGRFGAIPFIKDVKELGWDKL